MKDSESVVMDTKAEQVPSDEGQQNKQHNSGPERKAESHHTLLTQRNHLLKQVFAVEGRQENGAKDNLVTKLVA